MRGNALAHEMIAPATLDAVLELNPAATLAWFESGKLKFSARDFAGAALDFSKSAELKKDDPQTSYWLALAFYKSGYYEGALESALRAAELKPDSYQAAGLLGDVYAASGDLPKAKEFYLKAAGLSSQYAAYYNARLNALGRRAGKR